MNMSDATRRIGGLALGALLAGAAVGCNGSAARWSTGYSDMRHERTNDTAMSGVRVEFVSPDEMRWAPVVTGHQLIATSHFWRDTPIPNDPAVADSQLRMQAARIGANYVRWTAIREESPSFGERYRYRAVFYRGHEDPLPMAAAIPSSQPDIRIVEGPAGNQPAVASQQGGAKPVDGIGPGERVAEAGGSPSMSDN